MVVFDSKFLLLFLNPTLGKEGNPSGNVLANFQRLEHLIQQLEKSRTKIIVPTPVLSEVLVYAGKARVAFVETLRNSSAFVIQPFEQLAAIEAAIMTRAALDADDKKSGLETAWAKVKLDRQIVAIAKVVKATMIYSDDSDVRKLAAEVGIADTGIAELPLPPESAQRELDLPAPAEMPKDAPPETPEVPDKDE
jgi:predicted nucleic acid-binding protein